MSFRETVVLLIVSPIFCLMFIVFAYLVYRFFCRSVRVKFLQAYLLSGGPNGRLARGDAMIEMDFIDETREEEAESGDEFYFT